MTLLNSEDLKQVVHRKLNIHFSSQTLHFFCNTYNIWQSLLEAKVNQITSSTDLWTQLSLSSAVLQEKYLAFPAGNVTWKQCSCPRTDACRGLISTPPQLRSNVCMTLCVWPESRDSWDLDVRNLGGTGTLKYIVAAG